MSEQDVAREAFNAGRIHPHCPNCGSMELRVNRKRNKDTEGNDWASYRCDNCNESFKATVEKRL